MWIVFFSSYCCNSYDIEWFLKAIPYSLACPCLNILLRYLYILFDSCFVNTFMKAYCCVLQSSYMPDGLSRAITMPAFPVWHCRVLFQLLEKCPLKVTGKYIRITRRSCNSRLCCSEHKGYRNWNIISFRSPATMEYL